MKADRLILLTLVPLSALIAWSFAWGLADLRIMKPRQSMFVWEFVGKIDKPSAWKEGASALASARKLNPLDANYDYYLGKFHEWKALDYPIWSSDSRKHRDKAIELYQATITKRPTWSLAWTSLAQCKFLNQEMDAEAFDAMRKALVLGQNEPLIQYKLTWISMMVWEHLSDELKTLMKDTIRKSLQHHKQAGHIIKMLVQLNRESIIFPMIKDPRLIEILGKELEKRGGKQKKESSNKAYTLLASAYGALQ